MVRLAHGTEGFWASNGGSDLGIRGSFTVWNTQQRLPAIFLELGPHQIEFTSKRAQFTAKVAFEL